METHPIYIYRSKSFPSKHPENIQYDAFVKIFGEEGNLMVIALKEEEFFEPESLRNGLPLTKNRIFPEVDFVYPPTMLENWSRTKTEIICAQTSF